MKPLDELLLKVLDDIANTRPISPIDREELRLILKDTEELRHIVGAWKNGRGDINVNTIRARSGEFEITPIETLSMYYSNTTSIPNNAETALVQSGWEYVTGKSKLYRVNGDKIEVTYPSRVLGAFALGNWAENGTGRRALSLKAYDSSDAQVGGLNFYSFKGSGLVGVPDVFPGFSWIPLEEDTAYYKMFAYQNSGAALDLEYYELTLIALV